MHESIKTRLTQALEGDAPQPLPYVAYTDFHSTDPGWVELEKMGFGWLHYISPFKVTWPEFEKMEQVEIAGSRQRKTTTWRTPIGNMSMVSMDGWVTEYWLKTPGDYQVLEWIFRNMSVEAVPSIYHEAVDWLGERGLPLTYIGRSPYQTICVDWAGLENFSYHLGEGFPEFQALLDAIQDFGLITAEAACKIPGKYISLLENLTSDQVGPRRFKAYHLSYYSKLMEILHKRDKKVYAHYDGKLKSLANLISITDIDGIDSFTEPPEGDMMLSEARSAWHDKCLWVNINVSLYGLPERELVEKVHRLADEGASDGRNLIFEVSEDLPVNWKDSIPVVLDALSSK